MAIKTPEELQALLESLGALKSEVPYETKSPNLVASEKQNELYNKEANEAEEQRKLDERRFVGSRGGEASMPQPKTIPPKPKIIEEKESPINTEISPVNRETIPSLADTLKKDRESLPVGDISKNSSTSAKNISNVSKINNNPENKNVLEINSLIDAKSQQKSEEDPEIVEIKKKLREARDAKPDSKLAWMDAIANISNMINAQLGKPTFEHKSFSEAAEKGRLENLKSLVDEYNALRQGKYNETQAAYTKELMTSARNKNIMDKAAYDQFGMNVDAWEKQNPGKKLIYNPKTNRFDTAIREPSEEDRLRLQEIRLRTDALKQNAIDKAAERKDLVTAKKESKDWDNVNRDIQTFSASGARSYLGRNANMYDRYKSIEQIFNADGNFEKKSKEEQIKILDKLMKAQGEEIIASLATALTGGVSSEASRRELRPELLDAFIANKVQYATGKAQPSKMGDVLLPLIKTIYREKALIEQNLNNASESFLHKSHYNEKDSNGNLTESAKNKRQQFQGAVLSMFNGKTYELPELNKSENTSSINNTSDSSKELNIRLNRYMESTGMSKDDALDKLLKNNKITKDQYKQLRGI